MPNHIDLYLITTLTNLHAGRGDSNYGIVDNEVQRDPVLGLPVIFASSLKGALRELLERHRDVLKEQHKTEEAAKMQSQILDIFGNEVKNAQIVKPGKYIFHEARLLSLPVRADEQPFYHATTLDVLKELKNNFSAFVTGTNSWSKALDEVAKLPLISAKPAAFLPGSIDEYQADRMSDDHKAKTGVLQQGLKLLDFPLALFPVNLFKQVCERLPVIARNQLENGVSKNLFYEEVVPRQSRFVFFVERPENDDNLHQHLKITFNNRIQVGANASIGYGVCRVERLFSTDPSTEKK